MLSPYEVDMVHMLANSHRLTHTVESSDIFSEFVTEA